VRPIHLFTIAGIPFYLDPWFFFLALILVRTVSTVAEGAVWIAVVTFSVLVHEAGHAFVARAFKLGPTVILHGWGGTTSHTPAARDSHEALIVAAGPGAGLTVGGIVLVAAVALGMFSEGGVVAERPLLGTALTALLFTNIGWSLFNLLPLFPLDGGKLFRLAANRLLPSGIAVLVTHGTGFVLAVIWCIGGFYSGSFFMGIIGGLFAFQNAMILLGQQSSPDVRPPPVKAGVVLGPMRKAWAAKDAQEAVRLAHVARGNALPAELAAELYTMLVVGNVALGDPAEAISWVRYAPPTPPVVEAHARALIALGRGAEVSELLARSGGGLSASIREELARG
jgi:stage IV sporulation protein FB